MKYLVLYISIAIGLAGCGIETIKVHVAPSATSMAGEHTYSFSRTSPQEAGDYVVYESLVDTELSKYGFALTLADRGSYIVSLAYDTRYANVLIDAGDRDCSSAPGVEQHVGTNFLGRPIYSHSLTVRFFERFTGREVYGATSTVEDTNPEATAAIPYLVKSALARLPYRNGENWKVMFDRRIAGEVPQVKLIEAAGQCE
ncbi:DUF4136 domain-containing protein [Paraburkholderia susongensis]|uniref:DUF4136 domain-containing protein n=1 Tax=Paraburkholderia susongensis TaxID=1515439 RepID=UPI000A1CADFB|nr:DUF4136 domain-containing protein [Paraburkholderia susongensis]